MPDLAALAVFALTMSLTPGPNVVMVTANAATVGFRRALPHVLGIVAGFWLMIVLSGFGLAALFQAEPRLQALLKIAGTGYLLWLAWRIANAGATGTASPARPISFGEALLFQWVNPKGWISALGALAAYTDPAGPALQQAFVIAFVLAAICGLSVALWAGFGAAVGRLLGRPAIRFAFNRTMAGLLVLSLVSVL